MTPDAQIPPGLVVKCQGIDNAEVIFQLIWRWTIVQTSCRHRISRCEPLSPLQAHRFPTKSDGMWIRRLTRKVNGKLTTVFAPEHLEALARQSEFIQRSSSKLRGKDFVELMTTEMLEAPDISLEGLCDILGQLNPQAQMTPQALHQRINTYAVTYLGSQA